MTTRAVNNELNWGEIRLVVFDVDGTLYDQRGLRLCMLREMVLFAIKNRTIQFIRILSAYRRLREHLGEALHEDFERELTTQTAALVGCSEEQVRSNGWSGDRFATSFVIATPGCLSCFKLCVR